MRLCNVNAIPSDGIAVAVSIRTYCNQNTNAPETMVINIATDSERTANQLDIPIYMPVQGNYKSGEHMQMLKLFQKDPFVALEFTNLKIHISRNGLYYGTADSFSIVYDAKERLEDVLL